MATSAIQATHMGEVAAPLPVGAVSCLPPSTAVKTLADGTKGTRRSIAQQDASPPTVIVALLLPPPRLLNHLPPRNLLQHPRLLLQPNPLHRNPLQSPKTQRADSQRQGTLEHLAKMDACGWWMAQAASLTRRPSTSLL